MDDRDAVFSSGLTALIGAERAGRVKCLVSTGSTNDRVRELAELGAPEGSVVIAREQTAGRGRLARRFISPDSRGLYLSMLLRPRVSAELVPELTAWTAVAVRRALSTLCGARIDIKWVNDLLIGGKKVCGILTELGSNLTAVVGVGVNVLGSASDFPPELAQRVTTLSACGGRVSVEETAAAVIRELDALAVAFPAAGDEYLDEYRRHCVVPGRRVSVDGRAALALGIDDGFGLTVRYDDGGTQTLRSGEVSVRGLEDYI